jgi:hypothetical protein
MVLVHGKGGALWEADCDNNSLEKWGIDIAPIRSDAPQGPPPSRGGRGGLTDQGYTTTSAGSQGGPRQGCGDGEEVTRAASAQRRRDARSVSWRDRPWGVSDGGREGSRVGPYALRSLSRRGSGPARGGSGPLRHGARWAMGHPSTSVSSGAHAFTPRLCANSTRTSRCV